MRQIFVLGRLLVGSYFLYSGVHHFTDTRAMAHFAHLRGVPMPEIAVVAAGVLLVIAGLSFLLGFMPKLGIVAAALFLVPVTLMMHPFWKEEGAARMADMVNFTKNFGLLGAVLMFAGVPEPWPVSVGTRRFAFRAHRRPVHAFTH
ncbi:MAG TPA: DoxX family protein [Polyangia bacterium]|nr:DoxX family protein [Polyangia bacterium]